MCGICGAIGFDPKEAGELAVRRMLAAIVHRGPDEEGFLNATPVVAGSRRLSIIDLPGGSQPIWNEAETLAVVYNGEIYNFRELRQELQSHGHSFRTNSDTEVIVHAYEQWGDTCPSKLRGMFAFAVIEMPQGHNGRATRGYPEYADSVAFVGVVMPATLYTVSRTIGSVVDRVIVWCAPMAYHTSP